AVINCYASMEGYENSKAGQITLDVRLGRLDTPEIIGDNYVQLKDGSAIASFSVKTPVSEVVYEWKVESGAGVINSSGLFNSVTSGDVTISCRATRAGYASSEKATRSFAVISQKLNKPQISVKDNSTDLVAGEKYTLQVSNPIEGFVYKWTVSSGAFESAVGNSVIYTASSGVSDATISCIASISGFTDSEAGTLFVKTKLGKLKTPQVTPNKTVLKISETAEIIASSTEAGVTYCWILPSGSSAIGEKLQYSESTAGYKTVKCYATKTDYFDSEIIEVVLRIVSEEDNPELFLAAPELEIGGNSLELTASTNYTLSVKSPNALYTYNWEATSGSLSALTGSTVTYTAPDIVSTPVVKCYVSRSGFYDSAKTSLTFSVKLGKLAKPVISSAKTSIKIGEVLSLSASNGVEGSIFNWSVTSGGITSSGASVNYSDTTTGTKTIRCYGVKEGYYDSDAAEYVVNVVQSSDVTALSLNGAISHRVTQTGYDFGYAASEITKTLTFANISSGVVTLKSASLVSSPQFQLVGTIPTIVSVGGSCEIQVRFTPTVNEWSEGTLKLVDDTDAERDIKLLGSGYKQPSNISDLALWLRADRIANEDLIGEVYVEKMPDLSGRNMHAYRDTISSSPPNPYDRPVYQSNGINGLPTI
ncbi:MAG TPA: hypothetical protein PLO89_07495, partial [Spirochaetota bacterium]|nr:hypothetical protein [Spirochaetota bacterium]